jgi:very-short-patch-repair endonuclease
VKCRTVCPEWKRNAAIAGNIKQCNNKSANRLEVAGSEILRSIGIEFQEQVLIENKFLVDAFIPEYKIVIQWDGDYWHGFKVTNGELDHRQTKRMALDKSQDAYMKKCGYTVLRFWEHEVHNDTSKVYANIKRAIQ